MKDRYDRIQIVVKKGERDSIRAHADQQGETVSGFIARAISEAMERDKAK